MAEFGALVRPIGAGGRVAIFHPVARIVERARAHVDARDVFGSDFLVQLHPFVGADLVGLDDTPGELQAPGPLVLGTEAVAPVVARGEIAARPAHLGELQFPRGLDHVLAEPVFVRQRRLRIVDRAVKRVGGLLVRAVAPDRLHEDAIDTRVDLVDHAIDIDADRGRSGEADQRQQQDEGGETDGSGFHGRG